MINNGFIINKKLMSDFSQWLKKKRKESGMTLIQLKAAIGDLVTDAYLSKIENDRFANKKGQPSRPNKELVIALAEAFKEDVGFVLNLAGYPTENVRQIPSFIYSINWLEFNDEEKFAVERFIGFLMYERHRDNVVIDLEPGELFGTTTTNNNVKKVG
jgi:transcriptional regulator with XRE-family HTH domain